MNRLGTSKSAKSECGEILPADDSGALVVPPNGGNRSKQASNDSLIPPATNSILLPKGGFPKQSFEHLDAVLNSSAFASSKRCQQFLQYIVLETLAGRGDLLKERNIAYEVFGKGINFEPGEDSLVRVKAREVRKRLGDYYQSAPSSQVRFELPLGGYLPRILPSPEADVGSIPQQKVEERPKKNLSRRQFATIAGGAVAVAGAASLAPLWFHRSTPLDLLWRPVFATKTPLLVFIPILTDETTGDLTDRVGIGPAAALRRASDFLTLHNYPYHLRFGQDLSYSQMKEQPSLLLGGFSSRWTLDMTRGLRFSFLGRHNGIANAVIDTRTNQTWRAVNPTRDGYADQDYGISCRLFDPQSRQIVMVAGGITTFGTEGAASIFFDPSLFANLVKNAPRDWETKNIEAVVRVSIIGSTPSAPEVVATNFW